MKGKEFNISDVLKDKNITKVGALGDDILVLGNKDGNIALLFKIKTKFPSIVLNFEVDSTRIPSILESTPKYMYLITKPNFYDSLIDYSFVINFGECGKETMYYVEEKQVKLLKKWLKNIDISSWRIGFVEDGAIVIETVNPITSDIDSMAIVIAPRIVYKDIGEDIGSPIILTKDRFFFLSKSNKKEVIE